MRGGGALVLVLAQFLTPLEFLGRGDQNICCQSQQALSTIPELRVILSGKSTKPQSRELDFHPHGLREQDCWLRR